MIKNNMTRYSLQLFPTNAIDPADNTTYYWGVGAVNNIYGVGRLIIPMSGVITGVGIYILCVTAPSTNSWSFYARVGNATDYLLRTFNSSSTTLLYSSESLNIPINQGQELIIKEVCPTWSTNPTGVYKNITLYIKDN